LACVDCVWLEATIRICAQMPLGFDSIVCYLAAAANPQALIQMRIEKLNNQRVRTLRKIVAK